MDMDEIQDAMKFVMRCGDCGHTEFNALRTGHISCGQCGLTYMFIHTKPIRDWVFTAMSPQDFIEKKMKKIWDKEKSEYAPIKEVKEKEERIRQEDSKKKKKKKDLDKDTGEV